MELKRKKLLFVLIERTGPGTVSPAFELMNLIMQCYLQRLFYSFCVSIATLVFADVDNFAPN